MSDDGLVELGFTRCNDGTLLAPPDSVVALVPVGQFFELRIGLGNGAAVKAVLSRAAFKPLRPKGEHPSV